MIKATTRPVIMIQLVCVMMLLLETNSTPSIGDYLRGNDNSLTVTFAARAVDNTNGLTHN